MGPVGLFYPKRRDAMQINFSFARADSATHKATLPKDAVVTGIHVLQTSAAATDTGTISVGLGAVNTALVNALVMTTSAPVGLVNAGAQVGTSFLTKLTEDTKVTATYAVGSSTAGGVGSVIIDFFVAGPGEAVGD